MKIDYSNYRFSVKELILCILEAVMFCLFINYLFYKSPWFFFSVIPAVPVNMKIQKKLKISGRKKKLGYDFKEALNCLSVAYRAGYSTENAFIETEKALCDTLGASNPLTHEFAYINQRVKMNAPIEGLIRDFAERSGVEDIINFASVFTAAKRSGGNMAQIIGSTASQIEEKIDVEREIDMALASKKFEQRIMSLMPFAIILYMHAASYDLISVLYGSAIGVFVMTGILIIYAGAFILGNKIVTIEV